MLMTNQQTAELAQPGVGSFHDPAALITPQFAPILVAPLLIVLPVRRNQFNASLLQPLTQRVRIVAAVGDHALGLLQRAALRPRYADFRQRGFRKLNFCRRGTFQPNSQRKTLTRPLPSTSCPCPAWFYRRRRPFVRRRETAVEKGLVPSQQALGIQPSQQGTPRLQPDPFFLPALQPAPAGRRRRKLVREKMPRRAGLQNPQNALKTRPIRVGGRPRLSRRRFGLGSKGSISSHCSSVNSFCRVFMTEAHQLTCLTHKYLS